jgi:hypothetical protein
MLADRSGLALAAVGAEAAGVEAVGPGATVVAEAVLGFGCVGVPVVDTSSRDSEPNILWNSASEASMQDCSSPSLALQSFS